MKISFIPFVFSLVLSLTSPATQAEVFANQTYALGTLVTGQFKTDSEPKAEVCFRILDDEVRRLEFLLSAYDQNSDIYRLGQYSGQWIKVSPETAEILNKAKKIASETQGTFDPTVGSIVKLWNVDQDSHRVPEQSEIEAALALVDFNQIETKIENGVDYARIGKGQQITLGAIGKGFISDKVIAKLKSSGCVDSLISLGGNIIASGTNAENKPWSIGLQRPDEQRGDFFAVVPADNTSVVTSGDYEKFFIKDGVKYHHILNPKTGHPARATLSSVSVINKDSATADALCTALFVMGWDQAIQFLESHPSIKAVLVDENIKNVAITKNLLNEIVVVDEELKQTSIPAN